MLFLIIAILAFIVAVISLIVYTVQMNRTKKQYLGKDAVNEIARQAAEKARRKDSMITCDYCGCKIDTTQHAVCPQCGASYGKDKEWIHRHDVDNAAMEKNMQAGIARNKDTVRSLNAGRMRRVKLLIIGITSAIIFVATLAVLALTSVNKEIVRSDEIPSDYEAATYQITNPLIADNDTIKVELGDIYLRDDSYRPDETAYDYIIEVNITNKTTAQGTLDLEVAAVNGSCLYESLYEKIGANGEYKKMLRIPSYYFGEAFLKTISVNRLRFRNNDYDLLYEEEEVVSVETTADYTPEEKEPVGDVLFEKNGLVFTTFRKTEDDNAGYLQITNTGEFDFDIRTYASLVNGQPDKLWVDYFIPSGCQGETAVTNRIYLEDDEAVESIHIQLECKCEAHPEQNFVTVYLEIP